MNGANASVTTTTFAFAVSKGVPIGAIEAATGLTGLDLVDANARLPDAAAPQIWNLLADRFPDEALTIAMAQSAPLSVLGGLAHGAQFADTLRNAIRFLVSNSPVLADRLDVAFTEEAEEAHLAPTHPMDALDRGRTAEVGMGVVWRMIREILTDQPRLRRIELRYPPMGPPDAYAAFFGAPVLFEQPRTAMVLDRASLDRPVSQANLQLFGFVETHYEQQRRRLASKTTPGAETTLRRAVVENAERGVFTPAEAAKTAGLSLRSAQRAAAAEGVSLQEMIDAVRADTAKTLLADPIAAVGLVAGLLGYSDDRAFRRAFKRWTGRTPSEYRTDIER
ncbi:MAG: AraC family transcriptional regulator ligand-binding domain-containing protein [Pseudomonadota bacterium]